jgi:hypothetical protein
LAAATVRAVLFYAFSNQFMEVRRNIRVLKRCMDVSQQPSSKTFFLHQVRVKSLACNDLRSCHTRPRQPAAEYKRRGSDWKLVKRELFLMPRSGLHHRTQIHRFGCCRLEIEDFPVIDFFFPIQRISYMGVIVGQPAFITKIAEDK